MPSPWSLLAAGLFWLAIGTGCRSDEPVRSDLGQDKSRSGHVAVPAPSAKALAFFESGVRLWFFGRAWGLAVPAIILFSGLSAKIRRFASGKGRPWLVELGIYAVIFLSLDFLLNLPWRYYTGYVRLHDYGLSTQSLGRWFGDALKGLAVEMVGALLFLWVPYALMARSPKRWWFYTGLLILPFAGFSAFIAPVVVDPLFNKFGPMKNPRLEAKIMALAHRSGIEGGKIFEVDKSRDTTTVNAYVTGLFGTKRIVLWDTLLSKRDDDEVMVVMGHEMGHYVLNHVAWSLLFSTVGTTFALFLIHRASLALMSRHGSRFGFDRLSDVASVPLILLLAQVTILLGAPMVNAVSRYHEHEADRFALEITRTNHAAATSFARFQEDNLSVPDPGWISKVWRSTHPSLRERIEFCNEYRPWESGGSTRYGHLFREASDSLR